MADFNLGARTFKSFFYFGDCLITETTQRQKYCVIICIKKQRQSNHDAKVNSSDTYSVSQLYCDPFFSVRLRVMDLQDGAREKDTGLWIDMLQGHAEYFIKRTMSPMRMFAERSKQPLNNITSSWPWTTNIIKWVVSVFWLSKGDSSEHIERRKKKM